MSLNNPINNWAKEIRNKQLRKEKKKNKQEPISAWKDQIRINGEIKDSLNIILRTKGCSWARQGGCTMCGYLFDGSKEITQKQIYNQLNKVLKDLKPENGFYVKIFTSGSFFDNKEISKELRKKIIQRLKEQKNFLGLSIESRPEYITKSKITEITEEIKELIIGIGLETTDDEIRKECINKGYSFDDYKESIKLIKKEGYKAKTYLLLKPPFLSEKKSIEDVIESTKKVSELGADKISINPCNIQRGTIVEELYRNNEYRAPWIWSLIEILKKTHNLDSEVISDPVAAGKDRGIHNCGECDRELIDSIETYSKKQEKELLMNHYCGCKEEWKTILEQEQKSHNLIT